MLETKRIQESHKTLDLFLEKEEINNQSSNVVLKPQVIVDSRESSSRIPKLLKRHGAQLISKELEVGDYILSNRLVVERKTYSDFVGSIIDGRLFQPSSPGQYSQLARLAQQELPLILIQLESEMIERQIHVNSLMGAISSIILDFRIPIVFTQSDSETAALLYQLAKREQRGTTSEISLPTTSKKEQNIREIQMFMLATIPGINKTKAKNLLDKFHTINAIASADLEELIAVPQIGKKLAIRVQAVLNFPGDRILP